MLGPLNETHWLELKRWFRVSFSGSASTEVVALGAEKRSFRVTPLPLKYRSANTETETERDRQRVSCCWQGAGPACTHL